MPSHVKNVSILNARLLALYYFSRRLISPSSSSFSYCSLHPSPLAFSNCVQFPKGDVPQWVQDAMKVADIDISAALNPQTSALT